MLENNRARTPRQATPITRTGREFSRPRAAGLAGLAHGLDDLAATDQRGILTNRRRPAEQIALHRVAPLLREEAELRLGLDALGDDRHFKTMAEIDDGPH